MTKIITIGVVVIICLGLVFVIATKISSCGRMPDTVASVTETPKDTNFTPVTHDAFQPSSLPFEKKQFPVKLPEGTNEEDVSRIVTVETHHGTDTTDIHIIETNKGDVFVEKDSTITKLEVTTIEPRLFQFQSRFGLGFTIGWHSDSYKLSPSASFDPLRWSGWLDLPIATVDLDGIGVGAQAKIYDNIFLGVNQTWMFQGGNEVKAGIRFVF